MPRNYVRKRQFNLDGSPRKAYTTTKVRKEYTRSKVKKAPIAIDAAFAWGRRLVSYPNRSDQTTSLILRDHLEWPMQWSRIINIHLPRPLPKLPETSRDILSRKLEPGAKRGIRCQSCGHVIAIYSNTDTIMPHRYQWFMPQLLQECQCKHLAVLVDTLGRPNIYTDHQFCYTTPLNDLWVDHENLQVYEDIPKSLLDTKPWVLKDGPRVDEMSSVIRLPYWDSAGMLMSLAPLLYPLGEHLRRYAYTYKVIIITKKRLYLPDGSTKGLQAGLHIPQALRLAEGMELREYPTPLLTYLHLTTLRQIHIHRHLGKAYTDQQTYLKLQALRTKVSLLIRYALLHKDRPRDFQQALRHKLKPSPLKPPPIQEYALGFNPRFYKQLGYRPDVIAELKGSSN